MSAKKLYTVIYERDAVDDAWIGPVPTTPAC